MLKRKEARIALLNSDTEEMGETARRFLLLAGGLLLTGGLLWLLNIAATSLAGLAAVVMAFTQRLFPRHKPEPGPWWKRPLW